MGKTITIDIDFGGTTIKIALVEDGIIKSGSSLPAYSAQGLRPRLADVEKAILGLIEGPLTNYYGIGIAMPGLIDPLKKRVAEIYGKYNDCFDIDLEKWCIERFGLPMAMEQDSKAALVGEVNYGSAKGYKNALMLILGTGVGTAVMLDGKLLDSARHMAGSLGSHLIIEMNGRKCTCHGRGCLEAYTSSWALPGIVRDHPDFDRSGLKDEGSIDFFTLKKWVEQGDTVACEVLLQIASALRAGVISLIHAYDPDIVILSGGTLHMGAALTSPALDGINDELWGMGSRVKFVTAEHPNESVLLGLHYLVLKGTG